MTAGVRLIHGDCFDVLPTLPDESVDCVITDPPYNLGVKYRSTDDRRGDYREWCAAWLKELERVCRGAVLISCGTANLGMWHEVKKPRWVLCWWKPASSGRSPVGFCNWEPILLYGVKCRRRSCDVIRTGEQAGLGVRYKTDPIDHPCPKPVEWATKQILMMTEPGQSVLDCFTGSGTTGVACVRAGRGFIGVEISGDYFQVAGRRIAAERDRLSLFTHRTNGPCQADLIPGGLTLTPPAP